MGWAIEPLRKYATFSGRSRRKEYWLFVLFVIVVSLVLSGIDAAIGTYSTSAGTGLLSGIFSLAVLVPSIAVLLRRLHDIDRSGWWALLLLVPLVGGLILLIFALFDSTPGENRFGANPKGEAARAM